MTWNYCTGEAVLKNQKFCKKYRARNNHGTLFSPSGINCNSCPIFKVDASVDRNDEKAMKEALS